MNAPASAFTAFAYLQVITIWNRFRQRLLRLRQPKYLFGAIAGGAYIWFFFFRKVMQANTAPGVRGLNLSPELMIQFGALALFVMMVLAWLLPSDRAALKFSEAEVSFLFPAPLSRRLLIQLSLLRSQFAIFFSAFLLTLVFRRGASLGGSPLERATGMWLLLSTMSLHALAASFTRERLLDLGVRPAQRRMIVGSLLLCVIAGCWLWLHAHLSLPGKDEFSSPDAFSRYATGLLGKPPVSLVLAPFAVVIRPLFVKDTGDFLRALVPALLLLAAHYVWVTRSNISFEEASIDAARRRAEKTNAMLQGRLDGGRAPKKPRSAPFTLAPQGFAPIAFLWKGLIAMGPFWRLRTWLIACAILIAISGWLAADPNRKALLVIPGTCAFAMAVWGLLLGPMLMQRGMRRTMEQLDMLKAGPMRGWQMALGELLTPICVMSFAQWLFILQMALVAFGLRESEAVIPTGKIVAAAIGCALVVPPLCGLMLSVPFAGMLYFPAWAVAPGTRGGGIEVVGQRLIFMAGYLIVLVLVLIPPAALGGLGFWLISGLAGVPLALLSCSVIATAALVAELVGAIDWLGRRIDGFDVSQDMPR